MMDKKDFPLMEYDDEKTSLINPNENIQPLDFQPEKCVVCFFQEVIDKLDSEGRLKVLAELRSEIGKHKVYEFEYKGEKIALFHPTVGAPNAAGLLEEVIALGSRKFIACGGAGVLDANVGLGHIVIPQTAVRDEGTSYHYLPPSREVEASIEGINAIKSALNKSGHKYVVSKTWTTDAFYRETAGKIKLRRSEGCVTVEMECAAFFAVAKFREVVFAQMLYGGDDLSSEKWDSREWQKEISVRERLFWLAAESCLYL
ncbi:hypothetical protein GC098_07480 [Paenibacillus sp. LMG 31458]|uniref:Uridine phosphorylase n=1 Tax=Paenibacillus phytorum TaxID=2654977 RepID=A0ABX1XS83_9BACL|nr:nucleoside phosphorylase [Paenibacillus phytorum]NOU71264.1 hypothetical protein [Paenibacillus phytorum]